MSFWTGGKLCKLVQLYSNFGNLWDRKHPCYDNLRTRYTSYGEILRSLSMPVYVSVSDVICKLKEIRTVYVSELKKIGAASRAGCLYRPNHAWFEILNEFLYDHLDADEKLAELSSSEDGTASSEEMSRVRIDCCSGSNSTSDSDSESSLDSKCGTSGKKLRRCCKPTKKSRAYFLRSPTVLRSTKMNTRYEFPGKKGAASTPGEKSSTPNASTDLRRAQDMQRCTQLDVKMTSSDVSIEYLRTESVNGDEKCYKKNLKGPRCLTDKPRCFNNIKMVISKSGYAAPETAMKSDDREDEDTEFWEMMSMLDLDVPSPLTKLETIHSPKTGCSGMTKSSRLSSRNSCATCCASSCKDMGDKNGVEKIIESRGSSDRFDGRQSCCSKIEAFVKCDELQKRGETPLEPCAKKIKVMCLGDGTLFDENLLELLQDLSIKICPVDARCASGNCSTKEGDPGQVSDDFLACKTCSSATWPVKEFQGDVNGGDSSNREMPSMTMTEGNVDAATREKESAGLRGDLESSSKPESDLGTSELGNETDSTPLNSSEGEKVGASFPPARRNYDVKVLLESADSRSSSGRDAILHEAKRELWEAGKLYNGGKYIGHEIFGPRTKTEDSSELDNFGAKVASSLKSMGKERAEKLKRMIAETLRGEKRTKFF